VAAGAAQARGVPQAGELLGGAFVAAGGEGEHQRVGRLPERVPLAGAEPGRDTIARSSPPSSLRAMDVSKYRHEGSITIDRAPDEVYAIVSDVTRTGELSPVCKSCAWDDPAQAGAPGAWFTGHNVIGELEWDTHCKVVAAQPGREFAWINHGRDGEHELVYWGYSFEPAGDGTKVTESWRILPAYPDMVRAGDPSIDPAPRMDGMAELARTGIQDTLANLKRVAEA
jgi:hypothetical protein